MTSNTLQNKQVRVVENFLPCSYEESQSAARWLTKQSLELQSWSINQSRELYYKVKKNNQDIDNTLLSLSSALSIAYKVQYTFKKGHRKNANFTADDVILTNLLEKNKFVTKKRASKKRDFLKRKLPIIMAWVSNNESYREMAAKLLTPDGETISRQYLYDFIKDQK